MIKIKNILKYKQLSFDELLSCFEQVKENGDVVVIKFDGERSENQYTVFISFPKHNDKPMIRADGDDLKDILLTVLDNYVKCY